MREREALSYVEAAEERERDTKRPQKKRKKSGHLCFRFWLSHVRKSREAKLLAKAMNVGALFAAFYGSREKSNQQQTGERHKKEQLNSLSLCLLLTRLAHVCSNTQKSNNEEEENAQNELARRRRRNGGGGVFWAEDSPPNGAAEIASDDATGKVRAFARAVDELHRRLFDVRVRVEVVRAERREAASDDETEETRWEKRRRRRRGGGGWVRAVFEERKLFVVRERGVSVKRVGFELRSCRARALAFTIRIHSSIVS